MLYLWSSILLCVILFYRLWTGKKSRSVGCLVGKTAIVTGGNDGIGFEIVLLLASRGCEVIIADIANSEESKKKVVRLTNNENISTRYLDLCSFASIRKFSEEMKESKKKIDILINNAGINGTEHRITEDGLNNTMQTNYLGAFLLTHLLLDLLKEAGEARIIFTGSTLSFISTLNSHNLSGVNISRNIIMPLFLYANSKLCNLLAAQEFGKKLKKYNIKVYSADPWICKTRIMNLSRKYAWFQGFQWLFVIIFARNPALGAQTAFHLATSQEVDGETGGAYILCRPWIKPWQLRNPDFCRSIWEKSEELVHLRPEEKI